MLVNKRVLVHQLGDPSCSLPSLIEVSPLSCSLLSAHPPGYVLSVLSHDEKVLRNNMHSFCLGALNTACLVC